jgi:hypothetical protein
MLRTLLQAVAVRNIPRIIISVTYRGSTIALLIGDISCM